MGAARRAVLACASQSGRTATPCATPPGRLCPRTAALGNRDVTGVRTLLDRLHAMTSMDVHSIRITKQDLYKLFLTKYGLPETTGWSPRRRLRFGYYLPSDHYEVLLDNILTQETDWIDVGGGGGLFPSNPSLGQVLSERARRLVVVDPSDNIARNPFAHERAKFLIEDYQTDDCFDLATLRMVAEHITNPPSVVRCLNRLLRLGGVVVILTVNKWSPVTVISRLIPFRLHYPIKRLFWGGEERDTFPTVYGMNTRRTLRSLFQDGGFEERHFSYLDDLAVFGRFRFLNYLELLAWRGLKCLRVPYPEQCLLCVYEKTEDVA